MSLLSIVERPSPRYDCSVQPSRAVLGSDHAGFPLKEAVKRHLIAKGVDVTDVGTMSADPAVDYPLYMHRACAAALEYGCPAFLFGGSGNGEQMAANKVHGIRAALGYSVDIATLARSHNDANALAMGARFTDEQTALAMVDAFLATPFEGGRHIARVAAIDPPKL